MVAAASQYAPAIEREHDQLPHEAGTAPPVAPSAEPAGSPGQQRRGRPAGPRPRGRFALGILQISALIGVIGIAVVAGAILVSSKVDGWIVGLAIGAGSVILTLFVLLTGRFARPR